MLWHLLSQFKQKYSPNMEIKRFTSTYGKFLGAARAIQTNAVNFSLLTLLLLVALVPKILTRYAAS